ncbi:MAG TPA: DinB family protein [Ilumatobacter sp.]|nr:DinB family protein [Ilumatobacter sp.]
MNDPTETLTRYLRSGFDALVWKLDGLSEYDLRRPLVPTGTNLLGVAKHVALVVAEYFGMVFGRPSAVPSFPDDGGPNADMWATADESAEYVIGLLRTAADEAVATVTELGLDAPGHVPWWGDRSEVTVFTIAVHVLAEVHRHTGQADIVRELIDDQIGWNQGRENLPGDADGVDAQWWRDYRDRLQATAESFR